MNPDDTSPSLSRELDRRNMAASARTELEDGLDRLAVLEADEDHATASRMRAAIIGAYTKLNRYTEHAEDLERVEEVVRDLTLDRHARRLGKAAGELKAAAGPLLDDEVLRDAVIVAADTAATEAAERELEELSRQRAQVAG